MPNFPFIVLKCIVLLRIDLFVSIFISMFWLYCTFFPSSARSLYPCFLPSLTSMAYNDLGIWVGPLTTPYINFSLYVLRGYLSFVGNMQCLCCIKWKILGHNRTCTGANASIQFLLSILPIRPSNNCNYNSMHNNIFTYRHVNNCVQK